MNQLPASAVSKGQYVRKSTGEIMRVVCSCVERQSAASASASVWEITGWSEGGPTRRMLLPPDSVVEIVGSSVAS